jgi:hypothetical protein
MAAVAYGLGLFLLMGMSFLAHWRTNATTFLVNAGLSIMIGLYAPDGLKYMGYSTFGAALGLMLIIYAFVCVGFAYLTLFKKENVE